MARRKEPSRIIALPAASGWETWKFGSNTTLEPTAKANEIALPCQQLVSTYIKLPVVEASNLQSIIQLELKHRDLIEDNETPVTHWIVTRGAERMTLGVAALTDRNDNLPYEHFDLSVRFFPLRSNALTIWEEQERLVLVASHGHEPVYFQVLCGTAWTRELISEIRTIQWRLETELNYAIEGVVLWCATEAQAAQLLQKELHIPVIIESKPQPRLPEIQLDLTPPKIKQQQRQKNLLLRVRKLALTISGFLILGFAAWGVVLMQLNAKVQKLDQQLQKVRPEAEMIHSIAKHWERLQPAIDRDRYPVEILYQIQKSMPEDIRLTQFEYSPNSVRFLGEARNVSSVATFLDQLKHKPEFKTWNWDMSQPKIFENNLATFQIEGKNP
jgi:hypothetical protein